VPQQVGEAATSPQQRREEAAEQEEERHAEAVHREHELIEEAVDVRLDVRDRPERGIERQRCMQADAQQHRERA